MPSHDSNGTTDNNTSHNSRSSSNSVQPASSNTVQPARNENEKTAPRRSHLHYAACTSRDDPFFSDELYRDMLNGQPNNNHVGSMYTTSKQQEIDSYFRRLMAPPRPQRKISPPPTPPPRLRMDTPKVGEIPYWDPEWNQWVNLDDADEPLVETQKPGECNPRSPTSS